MRHLLALTLVLLAGCSIGPAPRDAVATYDFGPEQARLAGNPARIPGTLLVPNATAPAWLDSTALVYRLAYQDGQVDKLGSSGDKPRHNGACEIDTVWTGGGDGACQGKICRVAEMEKGNQGRRRLLFGRRLATALLRKVRGSRFKVQS